MADQFDFDEGFDTDDDLIRAAFHGPLPEVEPAKGWKDVILSLENGQTTWDDLEDVDRRLLTYYDDKNTARPTLLHKMAENWAKDDYRQLSMATREAIVLYLLDQGILYTNKQDDPILNVAISYHTADFIDFLIGERPNLLPDLLTDTDTKGMNCLHKAFKDTLFDALRQFIQLKGKNQALMASVMSTVAKLLEHADVASILAKDELGNTPIHYAMDARLCLTPGYFKHADGKEYRYEDIVKSLFLLLEKDKSVTKNADLLFNKQHHSPYRYFVISKSGVDRSRKGSVQKPSGREPMVDRKENSMDMKAAGKPAFRDPMGDIRLPTKESPINPALPSVTTEYPASEWLQKPGRDLQPRLHQSVAHMGEEKRHDMAGMGLRPLLRRPADPLGIKRDEPQSPVVEAGVQHAISADAEGSKPRTVRQVVWGGPRGNEAAGSIASLVKCFFIRNNTDRNAKDLLYGKVASDKNLFFDASHFRGKPIGDVVDLINKISQAGGFEDTLSYVKIPALASEPHILPQPHRQNISNEKRQIKRSADSKRSSGRNNLVKVFDKLVEVNVRKIIRLHVEDNADEWAHTDTAIEMAIKGSNQYSGEVSRDALEIEEWDWCKPDINMDVIEYAVPSVQHIHLHWSGNQTVLYGWASSENGIPLLCRNPRSLLSKITLHAYQGLESSDRRDHMIRHFCNLVDSRTQHKIEVIPKPVSKSIIKSDRADADQDPLLREQMEKPRSDAWIEAMERFRGSLIRMHDKNMLTNTKRVKVALIDDGIDLQDFNTYRFAQCTGVSYCSSDISNGDPWWKSTNGHGTIMANMISRINPWVQLEVIKVQSSPSYIHGDGARSISPRSAADAINAAVVRGADIISMSWTITDVGFRMSVLSDSAPNVDGDKRRADENDLKLLQSAIDDAVKGDKRLLICSAADDVRLNGDNTFPYSQAPERILRIGSTGPQANRDLGSGSGGSITYYLPGNQVAEDRRPHSAKPVVYHNGSSVSTALAAGLASLIMYCCHCLHSCQAGAEYENCAKALRSHANMRKAFNSINRYFEWKDDDKIVPVWGLFGDKSSMLDKATNSEDKIKVLKELVACLCLDIK